MGTPLVQGVETALNGFGISLTDDGREVVVATEDGALVGAQFSQTTGHIASFDLVAGTSRVEVRPAPNGRTRFPSISGDGTRIAFNWSEPGQDHEQVFAIVRAP